MLSFLEKFWEKRAARKGFLLGIVLLRGYNSRACTRFGLGGPKGYLWSWVVMSLLCNLNCSDFEFVLYLL